MYKCLFFVVWFSFYLRFGVGLKLKINLCKWNADEENWTIRYLIWSCRLWLLNYYHLHVAIFHVPHLNHDCEFREVRNKYKKYKFCILLSFNCLDSWVSLFRHWYKLTFEQHWTICWNCAITQKGYFVISLLLNSCIKGHYFAGALGDIKR